MNNNKRKGKKKFILLAAILTILIIAVCVQKVLLTSPEYPTPTGPYSVGTNLFIATDKDRFETLSESYTGNRKIAVRSFYPAIETGNDNYLPVDDERVMKALAELYGLPISGDGYPSNSIVNAMAVKGEKFPVILFSHGSMSFSTQNMTTMEELASRGYVVLAVSHLYESVASIISETEVIYSEQKHILYNQMVMTEETNRRQVDLLNRLKLKIPDTEKEEIYRDIAKSFNKDIVPLLTVRIEDMKFLAEYLRVIDSDKSLPISDSMDLENIGVFGHSLGGMTAQYACSDINTPFKAGINMDSTQIIFDDRSHALQTPFAFFYSSEISLGKAGNIDITGTNDYFENNSSHEVFSLRFDGAGHFNFSDMNMMPPVFKFIPMLGLGKIQGEKMLKMLNMSVAEYFDRTLKGKRDNMYNNLDPEFKEISIIRK